MWSTNLMWRLGLLLFQVLQCVPQIKSWLYYIYTSKLAKHKKRQHMTHANNTSSTARLAMRLQWSGPLHCPAKYPEQPLLHWVLWRKWCLSVKMCWWQKSLRCQRSEILGKHSQPTTHGKHWKFLQPLFSNILAKLISHTWPGILFFKMRQPNHWLNNP